MAFMLVSFIVPTGGDGVEATNIHVRELKLGEYGILINDSYGPILITSIEIDNAILGSVYGQMKAVECIKPSSPMEQFKVVDSINELGGMIEKALKEELNIHSYTYIPPLRGGCNGEACPLHILLYISRREYRENIRERIATIVAEQFGSTYYGEKLCSKPPEIVIYITDFNPIVHRGNSSCGIFNCSKYFEQDVLYLINGSGEPFLRNLGFNESYLIGLSISFDVPYVSATIFVKKYYNKTISRSDIEDFIRENYKAISVLNKLIRRCGCINNDALLLIRITNKPYIEAEPLVNTSNNIVQEHPTANGNNVQTYTGEPEKSNDRGDVFINSINMKTHTADSVDSAVLTNTTRTLTGSQQNHRYYVMIIIIIIVLSAGALALSRRVYKTH